MPKKVNALLRSERDNECVNHHFAYNGKMPCTGLLKCTMCNTVRAQPEKDRYATPQSKAAPV